MGICLVRRLRTVWRRVVSLPECFCPLSVGYARISSKRQRFDLQLKALDAAGCDLIYLDTIPGDELWRRGLRKAFCTCRKGDVLMVWKLDRLSRKLADLLGIAELLQIKGTRLRILEGHAETMNVASPENRLILCILGCFAEFEHELIGVRTRHGVRARR